MLKTLGFLLLVSLASCQIWNQNTIFPSFAAIGPNVNLEWSLTATDIVIRLTTRTSGWVGFGLSPDGRMANSDVILAWTNPLTGAVQFVDGYTLQRNVVVDSMQDWQGLFYNRANGVTTVIFARKRVNNDVNDYDIGETNFVIWAYGTNFVNNFPAYHGTTRGSTTFGFLPVTNPVPQTLPPVTLPPFTFQPFTLPPVTLPPVTLPPVTLPPFTFLPFTLPPVPVTPTTVFPSTPMPTPTTVGPMTAAPTIATAAPTVTVPVPTNPPFIRFDESTVFANSLDLHPSYRMDWNTTATDFTFRLTVMTTGWVGFGLSPAGGMANSNVLLTWTQPNGFATMRDASLVNRVPIYDNTNNYKALYYRQVNGVTTVIASRLNRIPTELEGARDVDVTPLSNIVFAWGTGFNANGLPTYHNDLRGSRLVGLGAGLLPGR